MMMIIFSTICCLWRVCVWKMLIMTLFSFSNLLLVLFAECMTFSHSFKKCDAFSHIFFLDERDKCIKTTGDFYLLPFVKSSIK